MYNAHERVLIHYEMFSNNFDVTSNHAQWKQGRKTEALRACSLVFYFLPWA